jgi:BNR repeat-containing family member
MRCTFCLCLTGLLLASGLTAGPRPEQTPLPRADGYRGIWYYNQPSKDEFKYKYSGGFATYPQQHHPIAIYSKKANKTFFCYGGRSREKNELLHMVSYYDHATGKVPRPTILLNKKTDDAHDNPTLALDDDGYLWVFSNAHGRSRPAYIHRSRKPYDVSDFEQVLKTNFSYSQPWHLPGKGFLVLHTRYSPGRFLHWMTSSDGRRWNEPKLLAKVGQGHYQVSWRHGTRVGTAFNYHPKKGGLNARTNLYYLETPDQGKTWQTVEGKVIQTPLTEVQNPALVHDYEKEGLLVYLKDVQFDAKGRPVILYLTSKGYRAGPASGPRTWRTARWTGERWALQSVTTSDHNYDHGSLYLEADGWRLLAPTAPGPEPFGTGGEVELWSSKDEGRTWKKERAVTGNSPRNHTYVRRPLDAHPDFYALWADGKTREQSMSNLYFTNHAGDRVWRLPEKMAGEFATPELVR